MQEAVSVPAPSAPVSVEERRQLMDAAVIEWAGNGWKVESRSEFQAVFTKGKRPNHVLHLLLTLVTIGLWGIVWIIVSITSHVQRRIVSVDEYGQRRGH
jgi:hypothetical protein